MKKMLAAAVVGLLAIGGTAISATPAKAAPITCPGSQQVTKGDYGNWYCMNNGDNPTGAAKHKGNGEKY